MGWGKYAPISSLAVCVNPGSAFNCYWEMPFTSRARITLTNEGSEAAHRLYYQIDYTLCDVPADAARFCAQFRRVNPLPKGEVVTIVDGVQRPRPVRRHVVLVGREQQRLVGRGRAQVLHRRRREFPTICGTGTEDYFCGSYNFDVGGQYAEFTTPYAGMPLVLRPDGTYRSQQRFSLYRWHITDPIRFRSRPARHDAGARLAHAARGTCQLQDDIATVAYWYQTLPLAPFPALPDRDAREII